MASYGGGANWAGDDQSEQQANVAWSTDISASEVEKRALDIAGFTLPAHSTPVQAAKAMEEAWNDHHPSNEQVTRHGSTVRWPEGTNITNMSFTVDGGSSHEVPGLGDAVPVFGGLTVKNIC